MTGRIDGRDGGERHVAIVGGGFTGAMLAVHLLRAGSVCVTLCDPAERPGRGLAYGAADPIHLLNVRAANMSALPDDPGHFVRWLENRRVAEAALQFAPRLLYGHYVEDLLAEAVAAAPGRFVHRREQVESLDAGAGAGGPLLTLAGGSRIQAGKVALALGNAPARPPAGLIPDRLPRHAYFGNPWAPEAVQGLADNHVVLIVGTGLTAVDVALKLDEQGFRGTAIALSRRGLLPHAHAEPEAPAPLPAEALRPVTASTLLRRVRAHAAVSGWRAAVDGLRPVTRLLWSEAPVAERRRFLRHLRAWWDVHRHRLAPQLHARIERMMADGRLQVAAGKLGGAAAHGGRVQIMWRPRGSVTVQAMTVDRIINCTGPDFDPAGNPLLASLFDRQLARADACRIGIDVDDDGRVRAADGTLSSWLFAAGPPSRAASWEIVAVPDIRSQVAALADRLLD